MTVPKASLRFLKQDPRARLPVRAHPGDAGLDVCALEGGTVPPHGSLLVRTGLVMELSEGFVGWFANRSSMGKKGLQVMGGIIDAGYRGELLVNLWNVSSEPQGIQAGDKVTQLLILPIQTPLPEEAMALSQTSRGEQGFGSSGR